MCEVNVKKKSFSKSDIPHDMTRKAKKWLEV